MAVSGKSEKIVGGYLSARQSYLKAMGLYEAQQRRLFALFNVENEADLEQALLNNRQLHYDEVAKYNALAVAYDQQTAAYDRAVAAQQARIRQTIDDDIARLDD